MSAAQRWGGFCRGTPPLEVLTHEPCGGSTKASQREAMTRISEWRLEPSTALTIGTTHTCRISAGQNFNGHMA